MSYGHNQVRKELKKVTLALSLSESLFRGEEKLAHHRKFRGSLRHPVNFSVYANFMSQERGQQVKLVVFKVQEL